MNGLSVHHKTEDEPETRAYQPTMAAIVSNCQQGGASHGRSGGPPTPLLHQRVRHIREGQNTVSDGDYPKGLSHLVGGGR